MTRPPNDAEEMKKSGRKRKHFREEPGVRDIETIDAELRLAVRAWRVARVLNDWIPSTARIDELLDERAAALDRAPLHHLGPALTW